jgi:hypothetical protein
MTLQSDSLRPLTHEEHERILHIREVLWKDYEEEDLCSVRDGTLLDRETWAFLVSLIQNHALKAEIASGFTTPNPFVLCFDAANEPDILMVHPLHLPEELGGSENADTLFRATRAL